MVQVGAEQTDRLDVCDAGVGLRVPRREPDHQRFVLADEPAPEFHPVDAARGHPGERLRVEKEDIVVDHPHETAPDDAFDVNRAPMMPDVTNSNVPERLTSSCIRVMTSDGSTNSGIFKGSGMVRPSHHPGRVRAG